MTKLLTQQILDLSAACHVKLDTDQLHVGGERSVMSPHKFVFTGTCLDTRQRVVLKCSNHSLGIAEMHCEHTILQTLQTLPFSETVLAMPTELFYGLKHNYTVSITTFIEQATVFPAHTLEKQFFMALQALESQETFHATTLEHRANVRHVFAAHSPEYYQSATASFIASILQARPEQAAFLQIILQDFADTAQLLHVYDGYLIHTDFVPHNFRIAGDYMYLLDFSSFKIGNKYESWARFVNFMEVHSPALVPLLTDYIARDRGSDEAALLRLMRLHKALFLGQFYSRSLQTTTGDMQTLSSIRLDLWLGILQHIYHRTPVPAAVIDSYCAERNVLRSDTEKTRQQEFTLL